MKFELLRWNSDCAAAVQGRAPSLATTPKMRSRAIESESEFLSFFGDKLSKKYLIFELSGMGELHNARGFQAHNFHYEAGIGHTTRCSPS